MKKLLITGASGFLGWHCGLHQPPDWQLIGTYLNNKGVHADSQAIPLDLTKKDAVWKVMKTVRPDAVFHLAAYSGTGFCEKNPDETTPLNVAATSHLAEMCGELKSKLLFTSSEQVFDGEKGNYSENDLPSPKNKYGQQKLAAEKAIQSILPESVILRIAVLFGQKPPTAKSFLNQWLATWADKKPVTAFYDEIRPFLSGGSCAMSLYHLLEQGAEGTFHIGGSVAMSRYDFGKIVKEVMDLPEAELVSKSQREVEMPAFRPKDLSLDCSKLEGTGFELSHPLDELRRLKEVLEAY